MALLEDGMFQEAPDDLPLGPPHLAWSFNHDGEAKPGLVQARDSRMGLDTGGERRDRQEWVAAARPQGGVDAIAEAFPGATPIAGVRDNGDTAPVPVPTFGLTAGKPRPTGR